MRHSETQGRSQTRDHNSTVAQVVSGSDDETLQQQNCEHISDLKCQLREAELEDELTSVTATMHGIKSATISTKLGSTPIAKVQLEGSEAEALLDTGSPVSIISLEALAKQR